MGAAVSRYPTTIVDELQWIEVSLAEPCPICDACSDCTRLQTGEFAHCTRTVSEWPVLDGGWLHRLEHMRIQADVLSPA